jgi:hypothetical protein
MNFNVMALGEEADFEARTRFFAKRLLYAANFIYFDRIMIDKYYKVIEFRLGLLFNNYFFG